MGEVEWSPMQARIFAALLRVRADLSASYVEIEQRSANLGFMSRR